MASWIRFPPDQDLAHGYQVIELFAGKRRVARLGASIGLKTTAHDIAYDEAFSTKKGKSSMDINEPAGFLFHG